MRVAASCTFVACALLWGCGGVSLERASSGFVGCRAEEIRITDDHLEGGARSWTATCRGQRFYCSAVRTGYDDAQVECTPAGALFASPPPAAEATRSRVTTVAPDSSPRAQVTRRLVDGAPQIRAWLAVGEHFKLHLVAQPTTHAGLALLVVEHARTRDARPDCPLRLMIDGQLVELPSTEARVEGTSVWLQNQVELALVERLAAAERVVGRVCDDELIVDARGQAVLAELVTRVREESSFSSGGAERSDGGTGTDPAVDAGAHAPPE